MESQDSHRLPVRFLVSLLLIGAGTIHFIETPSHFAEDPLYGWFFVAAGAAQTIAAVVVATRPSTTLLIIVAAGSLGIIGVWVMTRTIGIPIGAEAGAIEAVGRPDLVAGSLELATAALAGWLVLRHPSLGIGRAFFALIALVVAGAVAFGAAGRREACRHFDPDLGPLAAVDGHSILPRGAPPLEVTPGNTINVKAGLLVNCGSETVTIERTEIISDSGNSAVIDSFAVLPEHPKAGETSGHHSGKGESVSVVPTNEHPELALFARVRGLREGNYFLNGVRISYMYRGRINSQVFATAVTIRVSSS